MRLLNVFSRKLEFFVDEEALPKYTILSHTWGASEVVFNDLLKYPDLLRDGPDDGLDHPFALRDDFDPSNKPRDVLEWTAKIRGSCWQTAADGFTYVWIDTICIDKSSSSELSEAINSMYRWYQQAERCYVYMADVSNDDDILDTSSEFAKSRWFTRGWTLQELIAPEIVIFFSNHWMGLGDKKSSDQLCDRLSEITGIDRGLLNGSQYLLNFSVAQRMSWAAKRKTTRLEDQAYCLMGLFDVNMPMLYGEGRKAFIRLQEEIMKASDDQSLFTWVDTSHRYESRGLLAIAPEEFAKAGNYTYNPTKTPFWTTNKGLSITIPLYSIEKDIYVAILDCLRNYCEYVGIYLKRVPGRENNYCRVGHHTIVTPFKVGEPETIYIRQQSVHLQDYRSIYRFQRRKSPPQHLSYVLTKTLEYHAPETPLPNQFSIPSEAGRLAAVMVFEHEGREAFAVLVGLNWAEKPSVNIVKSSPDLESLSDYEQKFDPSRLSESMFLGPGQEYVTVRLEAVAVGDFDIEEKYMVDIDVEDFSQRLTEVPKEVELDIIQKLPPVYSKTFWGVD